MQRGERNQTSEGLTLQTENQIMEENHRSNLYSFSTVEKDNLFTLLSYPHALAL